MQRDADHIPYVTSGSYPIRGGNAVRPLVDGEPAFRRICQAVETAKQSVWITIAFLERGFEMPDGRGSLFDVLDRAVDRGLDVRAKIALVDDGWCTIGSANIGNRSFYGDTELNASFWHTPTVRALRSELLLEHLARDTAPLDDRAAFQLYREIARSNAPRRAAGTPLDGLAFALDPATYAS